MGYTSYTYGDVLTLKAGTEATTFTLYNADGTGGSVSFTLAFTGAWRMCVSGAVALGVTLLAIV